MHSAESLPQLYIFPNSHMRVTIQYTSAGIHTDDVKFYVLLFYKIQCFLRQSPRIICIQ